MSKFAHTAVLNSLGALVAFCKTTEELAAHTEEHGDVFVTKKSYAPTEGQPSWDELSGKVKVSDPSDAPKTRRAALPLEGNYTITKALPTVAEDHPKKPIWDAINANTSIEAAKAACPVENPKRKTSGTYSFSSEFRYFVKTGHITLA